MSCNCNIDIEYIWTKTTALFIYRTMAEASETKFSIGKDRFLVASKWNGQKRISLREYQSYEGGCKLYPTKKGVSLTVENWLDLKMIFDDVTTALTDAIDGNKEVNFTHHIGGNVYVTISTQWPTVNIRKWWIPENGDKVIPTRKGINLTSAEWDMIKKISKTLHIVVPELAYALPCSMRGDHQNQEGMLRCSHCNPNGCADWQSVL